jgi:signal transduction histidine kinase
VVSDTELALAPKIYPTCSNLSGQSRYRHYQAKYEGTEFRLIDLRNTLVELMGGDIWVESELEKAARFTFFPYHSKKD